MPQLPLLPTADTVVRTTVLDSWAVAIGALVLAVAVVLIWTPRRTHFGMRRALLGRLVRAATVALAFLALLPSVLPYDHLVVQGQPGHEDTHAAHCHGAPGECADAPIPSGPGQMLTNEPLVAPPAMLSLIVLAAVTPLVGEARRPELPPPLLAPPA